MTDLITERNRLMKELDTTADYLPTYGRRLAVAEREYKISLSRRTLELKQCGYPVSIIQDVTRGDQEVAELRFTRDTERELLKATYEKINVLKLQLRMIQEDIKIEWGRSNEN
jgi:hypothetical protein